MKAFRITVRREDEEMASALLWDEGTVGVEELASSAVESAFLAYFPDDDTTAPRLARRLADLPGSAIAPTEVPEVDWVARFRETFVPFAVGRFWITPAWSREPAPSGFRPLVVDPGQAFGTGTHETTRLCLLAIEELVPAAAPSRMLDLGTGSGILAIAAAKLGARQVAGVELDADAIPAARAHLRLNDAPVHLVHGDLGRPFASGVFDLVVANLMAPLILARSAEIAALASARGVLVLSGFLVSDVPEVGAAFAAVGSIETRADGEWAALLMRVGGGRR